MKKEEKEFYITSDINVSASLLTMGFTIITIVPRGDKVVEFYFDPYEVNPMMGLNVEECAKQYWSNEIKVSPKELMNNRRELLTRVHESQRNLEKGF